MWEETSSAMSLTYALGLLWDWSVRPYFILCAVIYLHTQIKWLFNWKKCPNANLCTYATYMELWTAWFSMRCPCLWRWGETRRSLSKPSHSVIHHSIYGNIQNLLMWETVIEWLEKPRFQILCTLFTFNLFLPLASVSSHWSAQLEMHDGTAHSRRPSLSVALFTLAEFLLVMPSFI